MRCKKDKSRICGAGWRNSVFKLVKTEKAYVAIEGETPEGCFKDTGNRDLTTYISKNTSSKECFK
jgi:hypothetical protein